MRLICLCCAELWTEWNCWGVMSMSSILDPLFYFAVAATCDKELGGNSNLLEEGWCFAQQKWVLSSDYLSTCTKLNRNNIFNAINDLCPYIIRLYFSHKWTNSPIYLKAEYLFYPHKHIPSHCNSFFHSHYCNNTIYKSNFNLIQNKKYLYLHILRHHKIFPGDKIWTLPWKK